MAYFLFKSEPDVFGWPDLMKLGEAGEEWHGIRNYAARNHMRTMAVGDRGFFYHSNIGKEVVGIVEVCRTSEPDSTTDDPRWDCVCVKAVTGFKRAVTLENCKHQPGLEKMILVNNTRLSVQPVTPEEWQIVCRMGGL